MGVASSWRQWTEAALDRFKQSVISDAVDEWRVNLCERKSFEHLI